MTTARDIIRQTICPTCPERQRLVIGLFFIGEVLESIVANLPVNGRDDVQAARVKIAEVETTVRDLLRDWPGL